MDNFADRTLIDWEYLIQITKPIGNKNESGIRLNNSTWFCWVWGFTSYKYAFNCDTEYR